MAVSSVLSWFSGSAATAATKVAKTANGVATSVATNPEIQAALTTAGNTAAGVANSAAIAAASGINSAVITVTGPEAQALVTNATAAGIDKGTEFVTSAAATVIGAAGGAAKKGAAYTVQAAAKRTQLAVERGLVGVTEAVREKLEGAKDSGPVHSDEQPAEEHQEKAANQPQPVPAQEVPVMPCPENIPAIPLSLVAVVCQIEILRSMGEKMAAEEAARKRAMFHSIQFYLEQPAPDPLDVMPMRPALKDLGQEIDETLPSLDSHLAAAHVEVEERQFREATLAAERFVKTNTARVS